MGENVVKITEECEGKPTQRTPLDKAPQEPLELGKIICMADVSGNTSVTPMSVSIAMGTLLSEICHPAFRIEKGGGGRVMTKVGKSFPCPGFPGSIIARITRKSSR